jgi:hypothetical protein
MIRTAIRVTMVAAAAVTLTGGVAVGSAQAQSMPRHSSVTPQVTQLSGPPWGIAHSAPPGKPWPVTAATAAPDTRDMGARAQPNGAAKPNWQTCTVITADAVNIRQSPWGTVIGTAFHTDKVSDRVNAAWDGAGEEWIQLVDYTRGNTLGWVIARYVSENNTPWWQCP